MYEILQHLNFIKLEHVAACVTCRQLSLVFFLLLDLLVSYTLLLLQQLKNFITTINQSHTHKKQKFSGGAEKSKHFYHRWRRRRLMHTCTKITRHRIYFNLISNSYFFLHFIFLQVTGVVGRAETLSSVFFIAAFIFYTKATRRKKCTGKLRLYICLFLL